MTINLVSWESREYWYCSICRLKYKVRIGDFKEHVGIQPGLQQSPRVTTDLCTEHN